MITLKIFKILTEYIPIYTLWHAYSVKWDIFTSANLGFCHRSLAKAYYNGTDGCIILSEERILLISW